MKCRHRGRMVRVLSRSNPSMVPDHGRPTAPGPPGRRAAPRRRSGRRRPPGSPGCRRCGSRRPGRPRPGVAPVAAVMGVATSRGRARSHCGKGTDADGVAQQHPAVAPVPPLEQPHPAGSAAGVGLGESPDGDPAGGRPDRAHDLGDPDPSRDWRTRPSWRSARAEPSSHHPMKLMKKPLRGSLPADQHQEPGGDQGRRARRRRWRRPGWPASGRGWRAHTSECSTRPPSSGDGREQVEHRQHHVDDGQPRQGRHDQPPAAAGLPGPSAPATAPRRRPR